MIIDVHDVNLQHGTSRKFTQGDRFKVARNAQLASNALTCVSTVGEHVSTAQLIAQGPQK